jgi:hypothetical protein
VAGVRPARHASARLSGVLPVIIWFSIVYLPVTVLIASGKQLWNDELFTFYIARLGSIDRIWPALLIAGDQNPPLFYWLTSIISNAFTDSLLSIRLLEIFGFWLLGACLIVFVSRHLPASYGLIAALLALVSGAYPYAYEARPYALMVGASALALLCWQRLGEAKNSVWAAGFAASLAVAVSVHYYGVLLFAPFALAESIRWYVEGRLRWIAWATMVVGATPLVVYLPLIKSAATYSGTFWARPTIGSFNDYYGFLLVPALLPVVVATLFGSVLLFIHGSSSHSTANETRITPPIIEVVAVSAFALLPALAVAIAIVFTGAYTHRYALPAVTGVSVLGAWAMSFAFRAMPRAAMIAALLLSLFFVAKQMRTVPWSTTVANHRELISLLEQRTSEIEDLVIADPHLYFELAHQAPALRPHMLYIAEPALALKHIHTDAVDRSLLGIQGFAPLQLKTLADVTSTRRPFLVYGYPAPNGWPWVVQELSSLGLSISVTEILNGRLLLVVNDPDPLVGQY